MLTYVCRPSKTERQQQKLRSNIRLSITTRQTVWKSADKHSENINSAAKLQINFNKLKVETPNNKNMFFQKMIFSRQQLPNCKLSG